jgi:hypothetical protein
MVLGGVPLAYHQGAVAASTLGDAWRFWPLIVIGIGLSLVLSRTPAFFVGGTVIAVCMGLIFGSALAIGPNVGCGGGQSSRSISQSGAFDGSTSVELDLQCGSATIAASTDGQWHVDASNTAGNTAHVTSTSGSLSVKSATDSGWSFDKGNDDWQIQLPANQQIDLASTLDLGDARFNLASANLASARFSLNLGTLHVNLSGSNVGSLNVSTNLGSAYVTLDGSSDLTGRLETNLGSLVVCVPSGLGVQVTSTDSLSSSDFSRAGLIRAGGSWQTPGFDSAAHRAVLTVKTSLGSLTLQPEGGC